jgi:hypothetical protein
MIKAFPISTIFDSYNVPRYGGNLLLFYRLSAKLLKLRRMSKWNLDETAPTQSRVAPQNTSLPAIHGVAKRAGSRLMTGVEKEDLRSWPAISVSRTTASAPFPLESKVYRPGSTLPG